MGIVGQQVRFQLAYGGGLVGVEVAAKAGGGGLVGQHRDHDNAHQGDEHEGGGEFEPQGAGEHGWWWGGALGVGSETVANAEDGGDVFGLGGIRFDLLAQVFDVDVDGAFVTVVGVALGAF